MKVELGGGQHPKGGEWINVDKDYGQGEYKIDFDAYPLCLPFSDATVDAIYSSHCLEHVRELWKLMREIVRICKSGASVEIRVPAPFSSMAVCYGHVHVIPDEQVEHWCKTAIDYWFKDSPRRLKHLGTKRIPGSSFTEASLIFPTLSSDQIMRFIPGTCHEHQYLFEVIPNESHRS